MLVRARRLEHLLQRGDAEARGPVLRGAGAAHAADARQLRLRGEIERDVVRAIRMLIRKQRDCKATAKRPQSNCSRPGAACAGGGIDSVGGGVEMVLAYRSRKGRKKKLLFSGS